MHPSARAFIEKMTALAPTPLHQMTPCDARRVFAERHSKLVAPTVTCTTKDLVIPGAEADVLVRLYNLPESVTKPTPVLVYFHGGGWVVGDLEMVDSLCHDLCLRSGATVVSVDYRLAPEHPFPAPLQDGRTVLQYLREYAVELNICPLSIVVAGDSAGGNIAAVLALEDAQAGRSLAGQVLIYPVTDISREHGSMDRFAQGLNLDRATMRWFAHAYQPYVQKRQDWRVSPLLAPMHTPSAPALVLTAGYDPLHDEGAAYANQLSQSGTEVEYVCFATQIHGFANQTLLSNDPQALRDLVAGFIKRRL
jgi:acetyl esterase